MNKITLQIPVDKTLKLSAEKVADEYGFSSLQEAIRIFMTQFANKTLSIGFSAKTPDAVLTLQQEANLTKKYKKTKKEIAQGIGFRARSTEEMMAQLRA